MKRRSSSSRTWSWARPSDLPRQHLIPHVAPLEAERAPVSFLIDYDGTISLVDIGDTLLARHYDDAAEIAAKDALYDAGELGSRELMRWDMDVLPHDADLLRREAAAMPQDQSLPAFVAAVEGRGAQVEVVSDGLGFYVRSNLAALGILQERHKCGKAPARGSNGHKAGDKVQRQDAPLVRGDIENLVDAGI